METKRCYPQRTGPQHRQIKNTHDRREKFGGRHNTKKHGGYKIHWCSLTLLFDSRQHLFSLEARYIDRLVGNDSKTVLPGVMKTCGEKKNSAATMCRLPKEESGERAGSERASPVLTKPEGFAREGTISDPFPPSTHFKAWRKMKESFFLIGGGRYQKLCMRRAQKKNTIPVAQELPSQGYIEEGGHGTRIDRGGTLSRSVESFEREGGGDT